MSTAILSKSFISTYLNWLRHNASQIPKSDRGTFPSYWFNPYQIIVYKNTLDDIAILLKRRVGGKYDKVVIRNCTDRIEKALLPNLSYSEWPLFKPKGDDAHDIIIRGGTYSVGHHPLFTVGLGSEIRLKDIRIEASVSGYPMEIELVWIMTFPNEKYLIKEKAQQAAEYDFWDDLSSSLTKNVVDILSFNRQIGIQTIRLYIQFLEKVSHEFNRLITRQDLVEQQLQEFLENHFFLLLENKPLVKKSREIGNYLTDFTLDLSDGSHLLVELQLNNDHIIVNDKLSGGFKEAITQVSDWINWIKNNDNMNINKYSGLIIIGRKFDYDSNKKRIDDELAKLSFDVKLKTYDDLLETIDKIKERLIKQSSKIS